MSSSLIDDSIEHRTTDALARSIGKNVDQGKEQRAGNYITISAISAERADQRHGNGLTPVAADEKP